MKKTTGIILGIILILALGMLGYAWAEQSTIIKNHEASTAASLSPTLGTATPLSTK